MPAQCHFEGSNRILAILLGAQAVDATLYLGLYLNTLQLANNATLASITEPAVGGYARLPLTRGSWNVQGNSANYAAQTFVPSGVDFGLIYGSFICTSLTGTAGILLYSDFLNSPIYVVAGKGIQIVPTIQA